MPDPISLSVSTADLAKALAPEDAAALESGALDKGQVWYEFITREDDRVRPSHRALHGTVWRSGDPNAPVPPLDYGCRCFIRYVAKPGTDAAKILPEAQAEPTTQAQAMREFLDKEPATKGKWAEWAKAADLLPLADRERFLAMSVAKDSGLPMGQAREVARMIMSQGQARALRAPALDPEAMKEKAAKAKAAKEAKANQVEMETKAKQEAEAKAKAEAEAKQSSEAWKILEALDTQAQASVAAAVAAVQAAMDYLGSLAPALAVHVSNMPMGQVKVAQEWVAKAVSSAGIVSTLRADAKAAPLAALDGIAKAATTAAQDANSKAKAAKVAADGAVSIAQKEIQAGQAAEAEAKAKAQAEAEAAAKAAAAASEALKAKAAAILKAAAAGESLPLDKPATLPAELDWLKLNKGSVATVTKQASPADLAAMLPTVGSLQGSDLALGITGKAPKTTPVVAVELPGGTYIVGGHTTAMVAIAQNKPAAVTLYQAEAVAKAKAQADAAKQAAEQQAKAEQMAKAKLEAEAAAAASKSLGGPELPPPLPTLPVGAAIPPAPLKPWDPAKPKAGGALASWKASQVQVQTQAPLATLRPQSQGDMPGKPGGTYTPDQVAAMARAPDTPRGTLTRDKYLPGVESRQAAESADLMNQATPAERTGITRFTHQWDFIMREVDKGATDAELVAHLKNKAPDGPGTLQDKAKQAREFHAAAYSAMARIPARRYEYLYRGHKNLTADQVAQVLSANEFSYGSLSSTSTDQGVAHRFAQPISGKHAMVFRMRNASGLPIKAVSVYSGEDELFITRQHRFRVIGWALDSSAPASAPRWIVDLEQTHP